MAWILPHKLRRAMVCPGRDLLHGHVEADEIYIDGAEKGLPGRQVEKKAIVMAAVEVYEPKGFARIRLQQVQMPVAISCSDLSSKQYPPGSVILTDGWKGYNSVERHGYNRT